MTAWIEVIVAPSDQDQDMDELGRLIAQELSFAVAGVLIREQEHEVAFWVEEGSEAQAVAATRRFLSHLSCEAQVSTRQAPPEKEWREAYKRYFKVARLTRQVVVVPSWETYEPVVDDCVLYLDPGQAFGTGSHATTTLVLTELQYLADAEHRITNILDAGTGSGILTIAAAKLFPGCINYAFDNDPLAVAATLENCANNSVVATVTCRNEPDPGVSGFNLIVANIQRHVLIDFADSLSMCAAENAVLILSGLLSHQLDEVSSRYTANAWVERARKLAHDDSEWGVLVLGRET